MTTRAGNADAGVVTVKAVPRRKQVYKITYPNGKIYVGMEVQQRLFERPVLAHTGSPVADTAGVIGIIGAVSGVIFHSDQGEGLIKQVEPCREKVSCSCGTVARKPGHLLGETMSTAAVETLSVGPDDERIRQLAVLRTLGVKLPKTAKILDFGCGAGKDLRAMRALGYVNAVGYDVADGRTLFEADRDHITLGTLLDLRLPYENNTFDLVISDQVFEHVQDQVRVFQELHRITKPGGHGLHMIPARYMPIEGHIFVPFGGVFQHRWWYKLWALLGVRNQYQTELSANETADYNAYFASEALRYLPTPFYRVVFKEIGFEYRFAEQEYIDDHVRPSMRKIGRLGKPAMWLYRTFRQRVVYLRKPD